MRDMSGKRLQIVLIGCGNIAERRYLPGFATIADRAKLAGIYDADTARMQATAARHDARTYPSLAALLADTRIDAVINLTPPAMHHEVNLAALRAGKHLLTEKTIAGTVEQATTLIEEARARGLVFLSAPAIGLGAQMTDLRRWVERGTIGQVVSVRAQLSTMGPAAWTEYTSDPTWFYQRGVGPLPDLGIYMLHTMTDLFGPARRMTAFSGISIPERVALYGPVAGKEITVTADDNTQMLLDFADPAGEGRALWGNLDSSFCVWQAPGPQLELYGDRGVLAVDNIYDPKGTIRLWRGSREGEPRWETLPPLTAWDADTRGLYIFEGARHLLACVRDGASPLLTPEQARHVLEIILAAPRSSREGRAIELETTFAYPKPWGTRMELE